MFDGLKHKAYIILKKSEKYTKTDMVYLAKGGFWLFAGQVSASAIGLVASLFFANLLLPSTFGTYRYILALGEILTVFSLSGLDLAIVTAVARGFGGVLRSAFRLNLKWSSLTLAVAWGASFYYYYRGNETISLGLLALGIVMPFITSANLYGAFLEGKKDFKKRTTYEVANNLIRTTVLIVALFFTKNPAILAAAYLGTHAIVAMISYKRIVRTFNLATENHAPAIRFGKHLSIINVITTIGEHIDKVLIFQHIGAVELAVYNFAAIVPDQGRNILKKIITLALPKLADKNSAQLKTTVYKKLLVSMIFLIPATLLYIAIAPYIYRFLFPQYLNSVPLSQFFALTFLLYGNLGNTALVAKNAVKEKYIVEITVAVTRVILMLLLIAPYGLWGIVISKVGTKYLGNLIVLYFIKKDGGSSPPTEKIERSVEIKS